MEAREKEFYFRCFCLDCDGYLFQRVPPRGRDQTMTDRDPYKNEWMDGAARQSIGIARGQASENLAYADDVLCLLALKHLFV